MTRYLITGGTGTFGQAYVRHLLADSAVERIVVFSRDELKQAQMSTALGPDPCDRLRFFLGDVRDRPRLEQAFAHIDTVIHAAALKRVDAVAYSSEEALKTNVLGTLNVCQAAIAAGVAKVVFLSSDKAVHATNLYGATKFMAEHLAITANVYGVPHGTRIAVTRYGNVLGSRGSVLDIWREQLARREMLTVTAIAMTRFWMSIEQAVDLVRLAAERLEGGEIFVPKLQALNIMDLAEAMGGEDYPIRSTGLRPGGEKLHESLVSDEEVSRTHDEGTHYVIAPSLPYWRRTPAKYGPLVPAGFRYTSANATPLDGPTIRQMLAPFQLPAAA